MNCAHTVMNTVCYAKTSSSEEESSEDEDETEKTKKKVAFCLLIAACDKHSLRDKLSVCLCRNYMLVLFCKTWLILKKCVRFLHRQSVYS